MSEHRHSFWFVVNRLVCACGTMQPVCPIPSSVTGSPCLLPVGHPPASPLRFHKFPALYGQAPS